MAASARRPPPLPCCPASAARDAAKVAARPLPLDSAVSCLCCGALPAERRRGAPAGGSPAWQLQRYRRRHGPLDLPHLHDPGPAASRLPRWAQHGSARRVTARHRHGGACSTLVMQAARRCHSCGFPGPVPAHLHGQLCPIALSAGCAGATQQDGWAWVGGAAGWHDGGEGTSLEAYGLADFVVHTVRWVGAARCQAQTPATSCVPSPPPYPIPRPSHPTPHTPGGQE